MADRSYYCALGPLREMGVGLEGQAGMRGQTGHQLAFILSSPSLEGLVLLHPITSFL